MKVSDRGAKAVTNSAAQIRAKELENKIKAGTTGNTDASQSVKDSSKVSVSTEAQAYQKAKAIASKDTVDEAKIARLQKLIDEGKYKIDSSAIADRLVDEHIATGE